MKTIIFKSKKAVAVIGLIVVSASRIYGGGAIFGATEFTQILNNIQLLLNNIQQYSQTYYQYKQMYEQIKNGQGLSNLIWNNANQHLVQLAGVVRQGQSLAYSMSNIDDEFRRRYKGYEEYLKDSMGITQFADQYRDWAKTNMDTIKASLKAANLQYQQFQTEDGTIRTLESMSKTSAGRLQAMQVGNDIGVEQIRQTQKLRSLIMTQLQMQASYMASQTEEKSMMNASDMLIRESTDVVVGDEARF